MTALPKAWWVYNASAFPMDIKQPFSPERIFIPPRGYAQVSEVGLKHLQRTYATLRVKGLAHLCPVCPESFETPRKAAAHFRAAHRLKPAEKVA